MEATPAAKAEHEAAPPSRDWADGLPYDLVVCFRDLLSMSDRVRFAAVCRPWRATLSPSQRRPMPSPWVVIPDGPGVEERDRFTLLSLPRDSCLRWTLPGTRCVGFSGGWLALVDASLRITLVNPLLPAPEAEARAVRLPPLWRVGSPTVAPRNFFGSPTVVPHSYAPDGGSVASFRFDPPGSTVCARALQDAYIVRVAFAPDPSAMDHAVAVMCRYGHGLAFTSAGRDGWQWLDCPFAWDEPIPPRPEPEDEHDDRNITVNADLDVAAGTPATCPVAPALYARCQLRAGQQLRYGKHLVFSDDGAQHVVWSDFDGFPRRKAEGSVVSRWQAMRIQRYEAGGPWPWREVQHLGGRAFLIGSRSQSASVPAAAVASSRWLRPNCVYFTNIMPEYSSASLRPHIVEFDLALGVFAAVNEFAYRELPHVAACNNPLALPDYRRPAGELGWDWHRAIWFTPSLK
ncbi:hypothetical protein ACP70R_002062 [Stipagrostis hirtigluma subsp. patula]